jgi:hypothetical protein
VIVALSSFQCTEHGRASQSNPMNPWKQHADSFAGLPCGRFLHKYCMINVSNQNGTTAWKKLMVKIINHAALLHAQSGLKSSDIIKMAAKLKESWANITTAVPSQSKTAQSKTAQSKKPAAGAKKLTADERLLLDEIERGHNMQPPGAVVIDVQKSEAPGRKRKTKKKHSRK